ncbi:hypothetical protein [Amphritea balenae]|uniref:hypothetical protein n=1 Tax=Amphritea balenae TaxID=452629 RepID=UPI00147308E5|nr:hypothetical protein [Amphritea balenae]
MNESLLNSIKEHWSEGICHLGTCYYSDEHLQKMHHAIQLEKLKDLLCEAGLLQRRE